MNTVSDVVDKLFDVASPEMAKPRAVEPMRNNMALHFRLTAAADRALADWYADEGKPEMANFYSAQASLHLDMAAQEESE